MLDAHQANGQSVSNNGAGEVLGDSIEIHMVELSKYNGSAETVTQSSSLEQWCYWIKYSSEHTAEELQALLPGLAFLRATKDIRNCFSTQLAVGR